MANKKKVASFTIGAAFASTVVFASEAEASTYEVQSGDSLWNIARDYNISVQVLKDMNDLDSNIIYPNQTLKTSEESSGQSDEGDVELVNDSQDDEEAQGSGSTQHHTVERGDTLGAISSQYGISLRDLMDWNDLDTTLIYPGDRLKVSESSNDESSSNESSDQNESNDSQSNNNQSTTTYTVKSGDTLGKIAGEYGVTVANLKSWNNLSSHLIYVDQTLDVKGVDSQPSENTSEQEKPSSVDYNVSKLVNIATDMEGVGYKWAGNSPSGFDCSGFIQYAYSQAGQDLQRHSSDGYYDRSHYVDEPKIGDLVFFEDTYKSGISHVGIYLGDNEFIHAGSDGVEIASLDNSYWNKHFADFKRFY
ncbi:C40 family peptidase [Alkalibacillus salilacus]|uniref:Peptidoglycan endopeptidase LytE n=1 Tax=Alkalibacillus salilacus TaxID=284582 RepID=A0ABT9VBM2_9BACI|nr:peptidoglycan endopeptidase [Alkalibacillus salilacus]MDQ0158314.1 peptidoglycan endopeptidase LytE [Alkalibacillus salilacus]